MSPIQRVRSWANRPAAIGHVAIVTAVFVTMTVTNGVELYSAKVKETKDAQHQAEVSKQAGCGFYFSVAALQGVITIPPSTPAGQQINDKLKAIEQSAQKASGVLGCLPSAQ